MKHRLFFPLVASLCFLRLLGVSLAIWAWGGAPGGQAPSADVTPVPPPGSPLLVDDSVPIGLIGTVTALGSDTVTIVGRPQGNAEPVTLSVLVDAKTSITKVGGAPGYATSTAGFSDFKKGMLLNVAATAAQGGARHAERIIIPPSAAR
jgi:hypothetical protein